MASSPAKSSFFEAYLWYSTFLRPGMQPYVVVELPRDRNPQGVDDAQHGIAGGHVLHQDADGQDVVQLVHGELLALHLLVDAVIMLGPAVNQDRKSVV